MLAPSGDGAYLVVGYTFQHIAEQAFLETESPATTEIPFNPVVALVAEPSRLAFDVPAGTQIAYSSQGVLDAMSRLPLRVVPLATPRRVFRLPPGGSGTRPIATLPGGLELTRGAAGVGVHPGGRTGPRRQAATSAARWPAR